MNGVAHVTFAGGGIVLAAREPYDRELLVEHVAEWVRRNGVVRVAIHGRIWNVRRIDDTVTAACTCCRRPLNGTCYATTPGDARHCLRCAFVGLPQSRSTWRPLAPTLRKQPMTDSLSERTTPRVLLIDGDEDAYRLTQAWSRRS